ncbi:hypothetical protein NDU88_006712 [Pleurodeles waltl]|uniref:Uncharacterized protein n=1 Tax=Pleurodeles waltl TaxID=8319 RepID=A0AAV7SQD7_PLEWA|nr:hypothetical protein NDU88_006712 [Pleurodeles waltl]
MQHDTKGSHAAGEPLRKLCVAGWSAGGLSCAVHEELHTQALATASHEVHGGTVLSGEASSYLHQIRTAGPWDCRGHFSRPPMLLDPRLSSGEENHATGCRSRELPAEAGK